MSIAFPNPATPITAQRENRRADFNTTARSFLKVSAEAKTHGLFNRARWFYLLVAVLVGSGLAGTATGLVLIGDSWWQLMIAAAAGVLLTQVAFLAHEAGHRQVLRTGPNNDRLARILAAGVVGISYSWWDSKHSRHHANPNQVDRDPDIAMDTISFVEADAAKASGIKRFVTQRQGWLFFPLLTLEGINLHYQGLKHLFQRAPVRGRWLELGLIAVRFVVVLGAIFWLLPFGMAVAFLAVQLAVFGVYMGASFAPNHKGMPIIDRETRLDFFSKQVLTSRNISGGWWATWLMGGLNYQIEHHLFPNMARPHLAKARVLVRAECDRLEVPYTETSLWRSYAIVVTYLNRVGLAARDPFDCPMNELRR